MGKTTKLTELDDIDLLEYLSDARDALFNLRFQFAAGQLDDSSAIRKAKRDVARSLTEVRSREIAAAEELEKVN